MSRDSTRIRPGEARNSDILRKHFLGKMRGSGKMSLEMQAGDVRVSTMFTVALQESGDVGVGTRFTVALQGCSGAG